MPQTHVRIPDKLHERVQTKAEELGISVNQALVILIAQGLEPRINVFCGQPPEPLTAAEYADMTSGDAPGPRLVEGF